MTTTELPDTTLASTQYLGLAPFLRASIAGQDLQLLANKILEQVVPACNNPLSLINLSIAVQCLGQKDLGLSLQKRALESQRTYRLLPRLAPTRLRLLMLVTAGSIQSHTPLECLLEDSDIELIFHYILAGEPLPEDLPAHDVLFVAIADVDENRQLLRALVAPLSQWPRPVLNAPAYLRHTVRDVASALLRDVPDLLVPPTVRAARAQLIAVADGALDITAVLPAQEFPIIVRPVGSQGGVDLKRIANPAELQAYLYQVAAREFFLSPFIDYSDAEGNFRKMRIALINGVPYISHMAISSHWMIHYVNAGMYQEAWKRTEESRFMQTFADFVERHQQAFDGMAKRMQLDYLVMDCAETLAGELLLFEIDSGGVVHAMDLESVFPYKNAQIYKARDALRTMLCNRAEAVATKI